MNLASSHRQSCRYPSGGEIDEIIEKRHKKNPHVQVIMTSESSEDEEEETKSRRLTARDERP